MRERSVVLLSGGLDSVANLVFCKVYDEPVLALTARYGQRAQDQEVRAAKGFADFYGIPHQVVNLPWLGQLGGSALTDAQAVMPSPEAGKLDDLTTTRETAKAVWVPNRNGVLINVAAAFAERHGARRLVVGFNAEEAVTFPDNSPEFLREATRALAYSTANGVEMQCYTATWDKRRIVSELRKVWSAVHRGEDFPFEKLWSCYTGQDRACGVCESCRRLARAIQS